MSGLGLAQALAQRLRVNAEVVPEVCDRPLTLHGDQDAAPDQLIGVLLRACHGRAAPALPRSESSHQDIRQLRPGIGFDALSTGSEEANNPGPAMPIAIVGSLVICTVVYILTAIAAAGALPAAGLAESDAPLAQALDAGAGIDWAASLMAFGAVVAITSVIPAMLFGQTRIVFVMARGGLVPERPAQGDPRTGTPLKLTIGFSLIMAVLAALVRLSELASS